MNLRLRYYVWYPASSIMFRLNTSKGTIFNGDSCSCLLGISLLCQPGNYFLVEANELMLSVRAVLKSFTK